MRKTNLFFVFVLVLCVNQILLSNSTEHIESNIDFGKEYVINNCTLNQVIDLSQNMDILPNNHRHGTWHVFRTPRERRIIEFNLSSLDFGVNSSVTIYDEFKSTVVWSANDLAQIPTISAKLVNLQPDSPYYILVSSDNESRGSSLIELTVGASPPPTNDLCEGATELGFLTCGDNMFFTADPEATPDPEATGNCVNDTDPAQWYTFTTPDPLEFKSMYNSFLSDVELFSTTSGCDGLVYEDCFNGTTTGNYGFDFLPGTTYYFLVSGDFFYSIPWYIDSTCDDPYWDGSWWWWWDNQIDFWSSTDCAEPSSVVPCENDHVVWYEFTTDCAESDVSISVNDEIFEDWWWGYGTAKEISITVIADDCATILSEYDPNGLGYVCSALGNGETLSLENLPPNFTFLVAFGSAFNELGHFGVSMTLDSEGGEVLNDICSDVEGLQNGINVDLSNNCATFDGAPFDALIPGCAGQSEATVWYEFDPGIEMQDITINLMELGINAPALAAFDGCVGGGVLGSVCGNTLELTCIDTPFLIEVGSSTLDAGTFELEIMTSPSPPPLIPEVTDDAICSGEETDILIEIPGGSLVDINVNVGPGSSTLVTGVVSQTFNGVNTATINQELINTSSSVQEVIYNVSISTPEGLCASEDVEVSVMVNPAFEITSLTFEECLPHFLELDISEVVMGGTAPYSSVSWYWNGTDLLSNSEQLNYSLNSNGQITVEVIDDAGCTETAEIDIEILDIITPTFNFPLSYCRSEQDFIIFPDITMEGIEGTWNTPLIDLAIFTMNGFFDLTFTPNEEYCSFPITLTIEISEGEMPEFDLPSIICAEDDLFVFPTEDLNGVAGTWEDLFIDLSTAVGVQFNTFTPFASQECLSSYEYVFEVGTSIELDFGEPENLCRSDAPVVLSSTSLDGFEGSWDQSTIDPGLVAGDVFTATWTPFADQSPCISSTTITININEPATAEFTLPEELCKNEGIYTFPTMDNQEINGSWSITTFDPNEMDGVVESVFTPDDGCALEYIWEINIITPLVPEFSLDTTFCALDELFVLPTTSENGIEGSWSQSSINPIMHAGEQLTLEFEGQSESCVETIELTFDVTEAMDPIFNLPERLCWEEQDLLLPILSDNAISGIWEPSIIDIQSNLGTTVTSTFTPDNGTCANVEDLSFELVAPYDVQALGTDPTGCIEEDGSIEIQMLQGGNLEFSIDNGLTWQMDNIFSSLSSGGYNILVRSSDFSSCQLSLETFLNSNDGPIITEVQSADISSCIVENGSIMIDAEGDNLEYSIDEGISWQGSNEFTGLSAGAYEISIRESLSDCIVETSAIIADFPLTEIMQIDKFEVSDCNQEDGRIEIMAMGEQLEYSIDDGVNWSSNNIFNGLLAGIYMIQVRSAISYDCIDTDVVELVSPDQPSLINWDAQNPTVCQPTTGSLEVEADGNNLEFSLDAGSTWQDENIFINLMAGSYQLIIRDREKINCMDEAQVLIIDELEVLQESTIDVTIPSDCDIQDGRLYIVNSESDLEYSIDGGLTWQGEPEFVDLASGTYEVVTRKALIPDCWIGQEAVIPEPECPCGDLVLKFDENNLNCSGYASLVSVVGMSNPDLNVLWQDGTQGQLNENVSEGWQYLMIEYDGYCEWLDSIYVEVLEPIQYELNTQDLDCPEMKNGTIEVVNVEGGSGNYSYALDGENYQLENVFTDLEAGSYEIYVRDNTDCITVNELDIESKEKIEILLPEVSIIKEGETIVLDPGVDASRIDGFLWTDGEGFENSSNLILEVAPSESMTYMLEVFYGDCIEVREVRIEVIEAEGIHMGNAFSPNGDNINDRFFIQGGANSSIELDGFIVLDRWGNKMFNVFQPEFNNSEDGWDGLFQGSRVSPGVYIYQVIYTEDGRSEILVGTVTIVD